MNKSKSRKIKVEENRELIDKTVFEEFIRELEISLKNEGRDGLGYLIMDWEIHGLESVIHELKEYNADFDLFNTGREEEEENEEGNKKPIKKLELVHITDEIVLVPKYITGYLCKERLSPSGNLEYLLVINPSLEETFFNNMVLTFVTEKQRNFILSRLKRKLEFFGFKIV